MLRNLIFTILLFLCVTSVANAQNVAICKEFIAGKIIDLPKPSYTSEAKTAKVDGKVEIRVKINENGDVFATAVVSGNPLLLETAIEAAKKAKYSPQMCDQKPMVTDGIIAYNFVLPIVEKYFVTEKTTDFNDLNIESKYFESIFFLTENVKIAFGSSENKFEAEKTLTRGEFVEFLFKTLNLLEERGKLSNKEPKQIGIYKSFNPKKLKNFSEIKDFEEMRPYAVSMRNLFEKFNIVFVNEANNFNGNFPMSQSEVIEYWKEVFGEEVLPVNFRNDKLKVINRGDFAIFLAESLEILTYKLLPE